MSTRPDFLAHDHAWLAQFGVTMPVSRVAAVRQTAREMAGGAGEIVSLALAVVGAWHLAATFAPVPMAWMVAVLQHAAAAVT